MKYLFEIKSLSEEPTIRLQQLRDLQAKYAQEAREKIYHEIKIRKNRGITFNEYVAGFGFYNYYSLCRSELERYLITGKEYTAPSKFDHHLPYSGLKIHDILVDTIPHAKHSICHVQPLPPSSVKHSSEEPALSFEALMLGYYPHVTIQEALRAPFESSYKPSAAGDQKGNIRMKVTDMVTDVKESTIFDPILATGDNSMTAAKVSRKPSVAARIGNWLRRLFSCIKKPKLTG
ncbi:uncharacterized protein LOC127838239 [Dreissena polymorpha]|uniref:uncharacterized protein LOC127838239 n=1 Tax=Dreissena polymorpha TaxID=45954 RepID=UPI002263FA14|nr:uncharacterized protein LOC127838239 [Dreissena polymorpha]